MKLTMTMIATDAILEPTWLRTSSLMVDCNKLAFTCRTTEGVIITWAMMDDDDDDDYDCDDDDGTVRSRNHPELEQDLSQYDYGLSLLMRMRLTMNI